MNKLINTIKSYPITSLVVGFLTIRNSIPKKDIYYTSYNYPDEILCVYSTNLLFFDSVTIWQNSKTKTNKLNEFHLHKINPIIVDTDENLS